MIVFEGCLALVIFLASQAPQRWSLRNFIPLMPMTCFFFVSVCKFLIPAWPSRRCHSQHSEAYSSRHVAGCGPAEKSTIYKSPLLKPSKTLELSDSISTIQWYLLKMTTISRSQSIETDMSLNPKDLTSMTLSMCLSFEIATLPRPNTLLSFISVGDMLQMWWIHE